MKKKLIELLEKHKKYGIPIDIAAKQILVLLNLDDSEIEKKYGKDHTIERIYGSLFPDMSKLKSNQFVCWGDGKVFYYLLTEVAKTIRELTKIEPRLWNYNYDGKGSGVLDKDIVEVIRDLEYKFKNDPELHDDIQEYLNCEIEKI